MLVIFLLTLAAAGSSLAADVPQSSASLTLNGRLDDPFWRSIPLQTLIPAETGVPEELGGDIRIGMRGGYLCFAAHLPEPGGKVLARSIGRNPVWERDAVELPEVEDRARYWLQYKSTVGIERTLTITINPWGAYRVEEGNEALPTLTILRAAEVTPQGWTVEAAVPLKALDLDWRLGKPEIRFRAERIRSRRALAAEFRWYWPAAGSFSSVTLPERSSVSTDVSAPNVQPPPLGNTEPPLEVGRVPHLPPVIAEWDAPAWRDIPEFELARNEPHPRAPRYPTRVKWMHDGRTLALLLYMAEPEPVVARAGGRDSAVTSDDHVAVYLATSGSAFLEIAVNTVGAIRDSLGIGPHAMRPSTGWNGEIETQTDIRHGHWIARINIPLEQCAAALGETGVPKHWRILLSRYRAARTGEAAESSTLPTVGGATTFYGPVRYQAMVLSDRDPAQVKKPEVAYQLPPGEGLARELATLDSNVWSPLYRRYHAVRLMLPRYLNKRVEEAVLAERHAWDKVTSREEWERFRDERIEGLKKSVGEFPPARPPLNARVTARLEGEGYRLENLVFQSRPDFWVAANLYLPARPLPAMPGIIIVPSQHYPKSQGELHDMGELWARTGCAVLIIERPGYGERTETTPWFRQGYASRFTFTRQLFLVGESYSGWAAWDVIRSVDFLYTRSDIDKDRIIVLGSVAGGAEPAAVAAALDSRIDAIVPFNYDQGHVRVHGDSPGQIAGQFSPWLVAASVAPRKFVRAFEFAWEGAEEPDYPNLWVDGMERSEKVWGFYNAQQNLGSSQGFGLIRFTAPRRSPCRSIGPEHREGLYPYFKQWFNIPYPSDRDRSILPDSQLSTNPRREAARRQEAQRRRPQTDFLSIPPEISAELTRKSMHEIALQMGKEQLRAVRSKRASLRAEDRLRRLREDLKPLLGGIDPTASPQARKVWTRSLSGAEVEGVSLEVEDGISVPLLLIRPQNRGAAPVVVAVAQCGKSRFLASRTKDIETLLRSGVAVCLPDVRGTGETSPSPDRGDSDGGLARKAFDLGRNLLGSRLKDLRTVLVYLRGRSDIDRQRIAVWGDSFSPPNPANLFLDEIEYEAGPQIQYTAEPMGAHLALLAGLYEGDIRAVAARSGLAGYITVLESAFTYTPSDITILGILKAGDIADIAAGLAPRPLMLEGFVNGRNIRLGASELDDLLSPARKAYRELRAEDRLTIRTEPKDVTTWLAAQLK